MEQPPEHKPEVKTEQEGKDQDFVRVRRMRRETGVEFGPGFRLLPRFIEPDTAEHMKNAIAESQAAMRSMVDHWIDRFTKPKSRRDEI